MKDSDFIANFDIFHAFCVLRYYKWLNIFRVVHCVGADKRPGKFNKEKLQSNLFTIRMYYTG